MSSVIGSSVRRGLTASMMLLGLLVLAPAAAQAGAGVGMAITFPTVVTVGDSGVPASITLQNLNDGPNVGDTNSVCNAGEASPPCDSPEQGIVLVPSCKQIAAGQCTAAGADPGVFQTSPTGTGRLGTSCGGMTFTITIIDPAFGRLRFTPQPAGAHVTLPGNGSTCIIDFSVDVIKSPAGDQNPALPGNQTGQAATHTQWVGAFGPGAISNFARVSSNGTTVQRAQPPSIVTSVSSPTVTLSAGTLGDNATVNGRVNPVSGATVTFRLYGPNDATCAGTPVFSSTVSYPVAGGSVPSATFTPTQAGTYRWIASYNGDANNLPVTGACNDANETTVVNRTTPTIATIASPDVVLGAGTLQDAATVSGRVNPVAGATIDFRLYGPNDATCAGAPVFTALNVPYPAAGGSVTSPAFTPSQAGMYRWVAAYSGDVNNAPVTGLCNDANETRVVNRATPTIATVASPDIVLGAGTLSDNATVSGRSNPVSGATVTFTLYGPNDATCTGTPAFSPAPVAYPVAGGSVASPAFTPTQPGTYRWVAAYSGDVDNAPVTGLCNAANETTVVSRAAPTIATVASPDIVLGSGTLTDVATVSGRTTPVAGATITWRLFGPNDATCTGTPAFAPAPVSYPVAGGPVTSPAFTPTQPGSYSWVAAYSGDANNAPVTGPCNAANETTVVTRAAPTIATVASADVVLGAGTLTDSATVSGRITPVAGATVDFRLYGPNNATCTGAPVFTSLNVAYPVTGGAVSSGAYTPASPGTYRWVASYSGDDNNAPVAGACNDAREFVAVTSPPPGTPPPPPPATTPPPPATTTTPPPPPASGVVPETVVCTTPPGPAPAGGELCARGAATISGRTGCQGTAFNVTVSGREIEQVVFTLDGKIVRVLSKPNSGSRWTLPVNPKAMRNGVHRVLARTIFTKQSGTKSRTLRVTFSRCARRATSPAFTG
jgi:hypothetical protein